MYLWMLMLGEKKRIVINSEFLYTHVATGNNFSSDEKQTIRSERKVITLLVQSGLIEKKYLRYYKKKIRYARKVYVWNKKRYFGKNLLLFMRNTEKNGSYLFEEYM